MFYQQDPQDKLNSLNRCFFDAEHGWIALALDRLASLDLAFPNDPQVRYAEGLIRKDFLGQGIEAEECFLAAQRNAANRSSRNKNYLFSTFNAAKYARNVDEYVRQERIARDLAPKDPDLQLFDQINAALAGGEHYADILAYAVAGYQQHGKHGDCAALGELALQAGEHRSDRKLDLIRVRAESLRELDKAAEASRFARGEGFAPEERLSLREAIIELDKALQLDPEDHLLWNFESAWLFLMDKPEEAVTAADRALSLCPVGYVKPLTNKALVLEKIGKKEEARLVALEALQAAQALGSEGGADAELASRILTRLEAPVPSDDELLGAIAERLVNATHLTAQQEVAQWKGSDEGARLLQGLKHRVFIAGRSWSNLYIKILSEMLTLFCAETAFTSVMKLADSHPEGYQHCLNAVLYIASHAEGVLQRDACRFLIFACLGAHEPDSIRKVYREAVLGSSAVGPGAFSKLDRHMRAEIEKTNPLLLKPVCDQPPLTGAELNWARNVTMARFIEGVSRDPEPKRSHKAGMMMTLLGQLFGQ